MSCDYPPARRKYSFWTCHEIHSSLASQCHCITYACLRAPTMFCNTSSIALLSYLWPGFTGTTANRHISFIKLGKVVSTHKKRFSSPFYTKCTQLSHILYSLAFQLQNGILLAYWSSLIYTTVHRKTSAHLHNAPPVPALQTSHEAPK